MRALVIDDSRAMRIILGGILKGLGFEVSEAGHGAEGLEKLRQTSLPDVILVDWNMPQMNGLEFVRAVRARPELKSVRLVMVTTETEANRMTQALSCGADEYVMKPFTRDALSLKLEQLGFVPA